MAQSTLKTLRSKYPQSPWIDDAKALEVELGGVSAARAVETDDEELKLYALESLYNAEPERAAKLIEDFLKGDHSTRLKRRALFVLAQTESPRAGPILAGLARDASNPELQREAIQALAISDEPSALAELGKVYKATRDNELKERILHAMIAADSPDVLVELALAETEPQLRRSAIHALGAMEAVGELERLAKAYGPDYRGEIFQAYGIADDIGPLLQVLRTSKDPEELDEAIEAIAIADQNDEARQVLRDLYRQTTDASVKKSIIQSAVVSDDIELVVGLARSESDPVLRKKAIETLGVMDAADELEELAGSLGPEYQDAVFQAYGISGATAPLVRVLRTSGDPEILGDALRALGIAGIDQESRAAILELYRKTTEASVKNDVLQALMIDDDAETLIEIFRSEKDPEMKRKALRQLSLMDDPAVQALIEELLGS